MATVTVEATVPTRGGEHHLRVYQANDTVIRLAFVDAAGAPVVLTGKTVEMYLKADAATADNAGGVVKLSTATTGITVVSAAGGTADATVSAANAANAGTRWYRVDVVDGSNKRSTALYGPLYTVDI